MKNTKTKLISSVTVLLICFAMLIGSTFAWFTDSASTGVNKIEAGTLEVGLEMKDADGNWVDAEGKTLAWQKESSHASEDVIWEPGATYQLPMLKIRNKGNLGLQFKVLISGISGDMDLLNALEFTCKYSMLEEYGEPRPVVVYETTFDGSELMNLPYEIPFDASGFDLDDDYNLRGYPLDTAYLPGEDFLNVGYYTIKAHMKETADNQYQGKALNNLSITIVATQTAGTEMDSFDDLYDKSADYPEVAVASASVTVDENNKVSTSVTVSTATKNENGDPIATVTIPEGVMMDGDNNTVTTTVEPTTTPSNISVAVTSDSQTFEVKVEGIATGENGNNVPLTITAYIGKNLDNVKLYHDGVEMVENNNSALGDQQYSYNRDSGYVTFASSTFSPFTATFNKESWAKHAATEYSKQENDVTYITNEAEMALFAKQVNDSGSSSCFSGQKFILEADLDLGDYLWEPIGQTGAGQFAGIFDGDGHTIKNLYINNTDVSGNCATGLFGWLNTAIVQNLTIDGANVSGHHNVGVIAGYLETSGCTIENCHVLNATVSCTSVNNEANGDKCGGIVGHAGNTGVSVTNCSVSNSTITAGRDAGQVVGAALEANIVRCSASNVNVSANGTSTGANIRNEVIGRVL